MDRPLAVLTGTTAASALALLTLCWLLHRRWRGAGAFPPWADLALAASVAVAGLAWAFGLQQSINPEWVPQGPDAWDYLNHTLSFLLPEYRFGSPFYAPLYPALAASWSGISGSTPHQAAIAVPLVATGLLPLASYLLLRELGPRVVALLGAWLVTLQPMTIHFLGTPSVYPVATLVTLLSVAALLRLLWAEQRRVGWALALGCGLGLLLATAWSGLTAILAALGIAGVSLLLEARQNRRRAALAAGSLLAPLVLSWLLLGQAPVPAAPLETAIHVSVEDHYWHFCEEAGLPHPQERVQPHPLVGWRAEGRQHPVGWWRPGRFSSLPRLPQVLAYLVLPKSVPAHAEQFRAYLRAEAAAFLELRVGLTLAVALVLPALAFLGAGGSRWRLAPWLLTAAAGFAFITAPLLGLLHSAPTPRYAHLFLCVGPSLLLVAAALPWRLRPATGRFGTLLWILPGLVLAWLLAGKGPVDFAARGAKEQRYVRLTMQEAGIRGLVRMARDLEPRDQVVDLTGAGGAHAPVAVTWGRADTVLAEVTVGASGPSLLRPLPGWPHGRRFLVLDCVWDVARAVGEHPQGRLVLRARGEEHAVEVEHCVLQDLQPGLPLEL